jgi:hypothetical protein
MVNASSLSEVVRQIELKRRYGSNSGALSNRSVCTKPLAVVVELWLCRLIRSYSSLFQLNRSAPRKASLLKHGAAAHSSTSHLAKELSMTSLRQRFYRGYAGPELFAGNTSLLHLRSLGICLLLQQVPRVVRTACHNMIQDLVSLLMALLWWRFACRFHLRPIPMAAS